MARAAVHAALARARGSASYGEEVDPTAGARAARSFRSAPPAAPPLALGGRGVLGEQSNFGTRTVSAGTQCRGQRERWAGVGESRQRAL